METLLKMINVFAWGVVILTPVIVVAKVYFQSRYDGSILEKLDNLNGVQASYTHDIPRYVLFFIISLVYLIVK